LYRAGFRLAAMSKLQNYKIAPDKFLTIATNVLFKTLLEVPRTTAKNVFNAISEGKRVSLLDMRMDDDGDVRFDLALDYSEYRGERLNFTSFRNSLTVLIGSLGENLRQGSQVPVFTEENDGSMLFGVPGITENDAGQQNVLMLGVNLASSATVLLKLQYLNPSQFELQQEEKQA